MNLPDEKREELRAAILDWPNAAWLRLPGPVDLTPDLTRHLAPLLAGWDEATYQRGLAEGEARVRARVEAVERSIASAAGQPVEDFTVNAWRQLLYMAAHDLRAALDVDAAETTGGGA